MSRTRPSDRSQLTAELNQLEQRMSGWKPGQPSLDRDRLLFAAGQAAARRDRRAACLMSGGLAAAAMWGIFLLTGGFDTGNYGTGGFGKGGAAGRPIARQSPVATGERAQPPGDRSASQGSGDAAAVPRAAYSAHSYAVLSRQIVGMSFARPAGSSSPNGSGGHLTPSPAPVPPRPSWTIRQGWDDFR